MNDRLSHQCFSRSTINARPLKWYCQLLTVAALKMRAPSMWSFRPYFFASSPTWSVYSTDRHLPPELHLHKKGPLDTAINYKKYETIVLWAYKFIKKHQMHINQTRKESHLECNIFIIIIIIIISFQFKTSLTLQAKDQNSWFSSKVQSFPLGIETFYHCNEVHRSEKLLLWITQTVKHLLPIIIKYTTQDHIF